LLTAQRFTAQEAFDLGFVTEVIDGAFEQRVLDFAGQIAANAPLASGITKWVTNQAAVGSLHGALDLETFTQTMLSGTKDHKSAVSAFKAKKDLNSLKFKGE